MTNHVHLLLTPDSVDGCARLMKHLGQLHTQYMNRTYGRTGTLWEGRFRSCLVQSERYALACYRYIELNPVRAGLAPDPANYPWSSHRANAHGAEDPLVTPHEEYLRLGDDESRLQAYRALFASPLAKEQIDAIRTATNGNVAFGDAAFKRETSAILGRRVEHGQPGRPSRSAKPSDGQADLLGESGKTWSVPDF